MCIFHRHFLLGLFFLCREKIQNILHCFPFFTATSFFRRACTALNDWLLSGLFSIILLLTKKKHIEFPWIACWTFESKFICKMNKLNHCSLCVNWINEFKCGNVQWTNLFEKIISVRLCFFHEFSGSSNTVATNGFREFHAWWIYCRVFFMH